MVVIFRTLFGNNQFVKGEKGRIGTFYNVKEEKVHDWVISRIWFPTGGHEGRVFNYCLL